MKKNRIITIVALIALLLICFSACSPDDNTADAPYEPIILIQSPMSFETNEVRSAFEKAKDYGLGIALVAEELPELENTTRKNPLNGQVLEYIYSHLSTYICQDCGEPAKYESRGWIAQECEKHKSKDSVKKKRRTYTVKIFGFDPTQGGKYERKIPCKEYWDEYMKCLKMSDAQFLHYVKTGEEN